MTKVEWQSYLDEIFPNEIMGFKRPTEPVPQDLEFSTAFKQFIAKDPVVYTLINALIRQVMSNDNLLKGWTDQLFDAVAKQDFDIVTALKKGLMSPEMLAKLNGIAAGANNYSHPANHPATMITQDAAHRFATDAEKAAWNGKASTAVVSTTANGLCPKRNGSAASYLRGDGTWQTPPGTYSHPANHPASMITQDAARRMVSDTQIGTWNGKANTTVVTQGANGLMSSADKKKLDGVAAGANAYSHPANHPASMITQDSARRMVSDAQINAWNGKANASHGTHVPGGGNANTFLRGDLTWQTLAALGGITAYSLNQNGYVKFACGLILQWGYGGSTGSRTITFPLKFTTSCYAILCTAVTTSNDYALIQGGSVTLTNFILKGQTSYWCAFGR